MASGVSKLIPSDPDKVTVTKQLAPTLLTLSAPFARFGHIKVGGRATIVKLADGALAVFSPVALTSGVKTTLDQTFGTSTPNVKYLIALDQLHHIFLESWHKEYPQAKIVAPETLPAHRDKQGYGKLKEENWVLIKKDDKKTGHSVDTGFDAEFEVEYVDAHMNKEIVFNHKPTRTLIEADLLFNLPATEQYSKTGISPTSGILTQIFCRLNGTKGNAIGQRRLLWYGVGSGDRKGFSESVRRIAKWDFDRVIPCHGDVVETGGKGVFEKVMAWYLEGEKTGK